jgi:hypothetical protein
VTVSDPRNGGGATIDGVDTLRNIEIIRFTDGDLVVASLPPSAPTIAAGAAVGGSGTVAVTWSAPAVTGGSPLASYTARVWTTAARTGSPAGSCTTVNGTTLTCTITGLTGGTYYADVVAKTSANITGPASAAVLVAPTVTTAVAASISPSAQNLSATQNSAIAATTPFTPSGFTGSITYTITGANSTALPTGITLDSATGVLSGTPSTTLATTAFTVSATDGTNTATATINITVNAVGASSISPSTQTISATQNTAITATTAYSPSNFAGSVSYSISGGTLPTGLNFDTTTGVISGTPTTTLSATNFTVTATDNTTSATATISIAVAAPNVGLVAPSSVTVTAGTGTAVITWSAVSGATRYTAQAFSSNSSTKVLRQCSVTGTGNALTFSCTIPRLQSHMTYYIEVVARNTAGAISTPTRIAVKIL